MRLKNKARIATAVFFSGLSIWLQTASAQSSLARVAVIDDKDARDLSALVTTELSTKPGVVLVERDDLAKIGDELKLQQLAGKDSVGLGKLVNADGLLFIGKVPGGFHIRFTSVGLGYVLLDDNLKPSADLGALAKSIADNLANYAPKLKLTPTDSITLSVLNLHSEYLTPESVGLERQLNLLLESKLLSLPGYVVLERRHAHSVGFEKSLQESPRSILKGASIVDGSFSVDKTGNITVQLLLRSPNQPGASFEVGGRTDNLPALIEQIIDQIRKNAGNATPTVQWDADKEAHEYYLEGLWGFRHHSYDAATQAFACDVAVEAFDSAELLGEKSAELRELRIMVFCNLAVAPITYGYNYNAIPDDPNPGARIDGILRAIDEETRFENENAVPQRLPYFDSRNASEFQLNKEQVFDALGTMVRRSGCALLVMLDHENNPRAGELRDALRAYLNYDPRHGGMPYDFQTAITFADDLSTTLDEEQAYYKNLCLTYPWDKQDGIDLQWTIGPLKFCPRFLSKPEEMSAGYFKFVNSLLDNPVSKPAGLLFLATREEGSQKTEALHAFFDELSAQRESLVRTTNINFFFDRAFALAHNNGAGDWAYPVLVDLLHYYFKNDSSFIGLPHLVAWIPEIPASAAPALLDDFHAYEARDPNARANKNYTVIEARLQERIASGDAKPSSSIQNSVHPAAAQQ